MSSLSLAVVAALAATSTAFRVKPARRGNATSGAAGMVDGLFTYGAPGTSSPGIKNPRRSDGCFPGQRFWTTRPQWFGLEVDTVVPIAGVIGFRHAKMEGVDLNDKQKTVSIKKCDSSTDYLMDYPVGLPKTELHDTERYVQQAAVISSLVQNISQIGLRKSYVQDPDEAARRVAEYGWNLVTTAIDDGSSSIIGGYQISHLIQNPHDLACIITFQGSSSIGDWLGNAAIGKAGFCGLPGISVHVGFRDHLRRMTKSSVFQSSVRPYLPSCSKVYVTGHSLGGALAELFTACVAHAPSPGQAGYDTDYKYMGWSVGRARKLPAIVEATV